MIFDAPSLLRIWSLATLGPLLAVAVLRALFQWRTLHGWDAVYFYTTLLGVILGVLLVIAAWVSRMYDEYIRLKDVPVRPAPTYRNEPLRIPNMNEKPLYNQVTGQLKIDLMTSRVKRCCRTLINQREEGFEIDLREDTWIGQFGGRRENYVYFRDVLMRDAFAKKDARKNSPFTVIDWRIVEAGAEGKF